MDEGREGGSPGSPAGPVMPKMRLPVELRFCDCGRWAAAVVCSSSKGACSRVAGGSSGATVAGSVPTLVGGGSVGVVIAKVRR